jgi:hypothetical protein
MSDHVGYTPESGSKIRVLASIVTGPDGLMLPPGAWSKIGISNHAV